MSTLLNLPALLTKCLNDMVPRFPSTKVTLRNMCLACEDWSELLIDKIGQENKAGKKDKPYPEGRPPCWAHHWTKRRSIKLSGRYTYIVDVNLLMHATPASQKGNVCVTGQVFTGPACAEELHGLYKNPSVSHLLEKKSLLWHRHTNNRCRRAVIGIFSREVLIYFNGHFGSCTSNNKWDGLSSS